jgi:mRNA interferase RelE/StbE
MAGFKPAISPSAAEVIRHLSPDLKRSVKQAIRVLCIDPHRGEPLQRELVGYWKYKVRRYGIIYAIDARQRIMLIMAVGHRRGIYEAAAERVRRR